MHHVSRLKLCGGNSKYPQIQNLILELELYGREEGQSLKRMSTWPNPNLPSSEESPGGIPDVERSISDMTLSGQQSSLQSSRPYF